MDGVDGVTQEPIAPGTRFVYEFPARPAGTYIYHSHFGYQLDQGLHGALIIEAKSERGHDREFVLATEDWATLDGGGPAAARAGRVGSGGMMGGMMGGMRGGMMGGRRGSGGDALPQPSYDASAINGLSGGKTFARQPL